MPSGRGKRGSIAGQAPVNIGALSRGGLPRGAPQAREHARGGKEQDGPCGSVDAESAELTITCGRSSKTRDVIVDVLATTWDALDASAKAATRLSQITMANGPERRGRRTPCLPRLVQLADAMHKPIPLLYSPPYHSHYHPSARCWGIVERQWHGTKLREAETMVEWAKRLPWKGLSPVVALSHKGYQKGLARGKAARQAVDKRWERHPALPQYDIVINPAPTS